jgi:hypothetical protein
MGSNEKPKLERGQHTFRLSLQDRAKLVIGNLQLDDVPVPELFVERMANAPLRVVLAVLMINGTEIPDFVYRGQTLLTGTRSPIERALALCLLNFSPSMEFSDAEDETTLVEYTPKEETWRFVVKTQPRVHTDSGPLKPDFAFWLPENSSKVLYVECDGHEFHAATKQQVSRDRKRDRQIVAQGHVVVRFTGSEIWKDANGCVAEIIELLELMRKEGL